MADRSRRALVLSMALASACGPAKVGSTSSSGDGADATTDFGEAETTDQTETTDESTTFMPMFDERGSDDCDPWQQDCPAGEKCVPYASTGGNWDANKCVPIMGEQAPGEPCTYAGTVEATDDCDASGMCWYTEEVDGALVGTCVEFCTGTPDAPICPEDHYCPVSGDGSIHICLFRCDPLGQNCEVGFGCYWTGSNFGCVSTTEDIPAGQPCGFINDCAPGLLCASPEALPDCAGAACCTPYCDLELGDAQCEAVPGTVCSTFFEPGMAPPNYEQLGVCVVP